MIKHIVFDMGNVLIRFDPDSFLDRFGADAADRELLRREVFLSLEWSRMDRGSLRDEEAVELICGRLPQRLHSLVRELICRWDEPVIEIPGMCELVRELKALGLGVYLLSNASLRQHEYWPRISASRYFDGILISADVQLVKPQPEIYRLLCRRFSLRPEECFFIDDSALNVEGAFFCGIPGAVFHSDVSELRSKLRAVGIPVSA